MDDPEYEVEDVRAQRRLSAPPPPSKRQAFPPGTVLSGRWRLGLTACSLVLAAAVILSAWLPLHNQPQFSTEFLSPTLPAAATPVLVPGGAPTPLPITSALATPPTTCPGASTLTTVTVPAFGGFTGRTVQLSGHAPVWIPAAYLPQKVTGIPEQAAPSDAMPAWWPSIFILWEIGPTSHPTATVRVRDLYTGALAWWSGDGSTPQASTLILPPGGPMPTGYSSYRTELFITQSGCYQMTVTWSGGSWSYIFAAGWGPTY